MPHVATALAADRIDPTPERLRRGDLQRRPVQFGGVTDVADVFQADAPTMLDHMRDHGEITSRQHLAGEHYQHLVLLAGRIRGRTGATTRLCPLRGKDSQSEGSAAAEMACIHAERALGRQVVYLNALCLEDARIDPALARRVLDALADHLRIARSQGGAGHRQAETGPDDVRAFRRAMPVYERQDAVQAGAHGRRC